jgi:DNA topoisomerase IA
MLPFDELSEQSKKKARGRHFKSEIHICAEGERQDTILKSLYLAFRDMDNDNKVIPVPLDYTYIKERKFQDSKDILCCSEVEKLIQLPSRRLQMNMPVEHVMIRESPIPKEFFDESGIPFAEYQYRGEKKTIYLPIKNPNEVCRLTCNIGNTGSGKSEKASNFAIEALLKSQSVFVLDPAQGTLCDSIRDALPKEFPEDHIIDFNFGDYEYPVSVHWDLKKNNNKKSSEDIDEQDKYISKEQASELIEKLKEHEAVIKKVEVKVKNEQPPLLFNLAELQSEANKKFKLPVDKTLEIAQSLYEKKMISYPRTDSRVLSTDVVGELPKILNGLFKNQAFKEHVLRIKEQGGLKINKSTKRYVDNSKVTDHYAIIPTYVTMELSHLDADTRNIYELIVKRFLAVFYPPAQYNTVKVETNLAGEIFISNAKTLLNLGWKEVYEVSAKKDEDEISDSPIHKLEKNEKSDVLSLDLEEKETKPPSRYTDGSLIITMEKAGKFIENEDLREQIKTCGIGTSATRSGIIKKLTEIGHIEIHKKTQIVTPTLKGEAIVNLVRQTAKELLNPSLTASWEKGLAMIENGETTESVFMEKLHSYIIKSIEKVKKTRNDNILQNVE